MIAVVILVIIDRISKLWALENNVSMCVIPGSINFTYVENRGMVFGLAQGSNLFMGIVSLIICIGIIGYLISIRKRDDTYCFGWCLVLAGGIGNMIDRFTLGYVVDFIDTPWIATFNLADAFIVIGIFVLLLHVLWGEKNHKTENRVGARYY